MRTTKATRIGDFVVLVDDTVSAVDPTAGVLFHGKKFLPSEKRERRNGALYSRIMPEAWAISSALVDSQRSKFVLYKSSQSPFYFYPSVSDRRLYAQTSALPPKKFTVVVMAHCLFGASIVGSEESGASHPLVDHNLQVQRYIKGVKVDRGSSGQTHLHPYEVTMFAALMRNIDTVKVLGTEDVYIRYHLPDIDYMLYGVRLFTLGKLSYRALDQYITEVSDRGSLHRRIIEEIGEKKGIKIIIESPFDNLRSSRETLTLDSLLENLSLSDEQMAVVKREYPDRFQSLVEDGELTRPNTNTTFSHSPSEANSSDSADTSDDDEETVRDSVSKFKQAITSLQSDLRLLRSQKRRRERQGKDTGDVDAEIDELDSLLALYEKFFVENLLRQLCQSSFHPMHQKAWQEIVEHLGAEKPNTLGELFKLANSAFLAFETSQKEKDRQNFEVCSILPIDEKPISENYGTLLSKRFGHIVSLFWLPPVLSLVNAKDEQSFHLNNLFRFRSMEHCFDLPAFLAELQSLMALDKTFLELILRNVGLLDADRSSLTFAQAITPSSPAQNSFSLFVPLSSADLAKSRKRSSPDPDREPFFSGDVESFDLRKVRSQPEMWPSNRENDNIPPAGLNVASSQISIRP